MEADIEKGRLSEEGSPNSSSTVQQSQSERKMTY